MISAHQHKGQQARRVLHQQKVRVIRRAKDDGYTLDQLQRLGRFKHRQSLIKFMERNGINSPIEVPNTAHST
ncbi:hypothetical protein KNJ79_05175 [Sphingopyxis indica]|uniref:hypothetical protein n=1 Tax=Sphingopyxis indica TaxID=436663 RepID=UPI0029390864|nr:hypothetical protein [Sphingopyxis indica]WOF44324.1 hypothetical protein KNJ79_05175 [Sphingopyxis indica]